ncbi:hypothetical protein GCM10017687_79520 [Streptomyces echinatus]
MRRYAPQNAEALLNTALGLLADHPAAFADQDAALLRVMLLGQLVDCRIRMGAVVPARDAQQQAVRVARAEGRADLLTAAYTTWTEPTPWRVRRTRPVIPRASRSSRTCWRITTRTTGSGACSSTSSPTHWTTPNPRA